MTRRARAHPTRRPGRGLPLRPGPGRRRGVLGLHGPGSLVGRVVRRRPPAAATPSRRAGPPSDQPDPRLPGGVLPGGGRGCAGIAEHGRALAATVPVPERRPGTERDDHEPDGELLRRTRRAPSRCRRPRPRPRPRPPSLEGEPALRAHELFGFAPYWSLPTSSGFNLVGPHDPGVLQPRRGGKRHRRRKRARGGWGTRARPSPTS